MPEVSSSEAPVISPGPRTFRRRRIGLALRDAVGTEVASVEISATGRVPGARLVSFGEGVVILLHFCQSAGILRASQAAATPSASQMARQPECCQVLVWQCLGWHNSCDPRTAEAREALCVVSR